MKRLPLMAALVTCWGLPGATSAQSFNIDLDSFSGSPEAGNGAPSSGFAGAAGQAGFWNRVDAAGPFQPATLGDLSGAPTAAQILATGGIGSYGGSAFAGNTGDFALLLNDSATIGGVGPEIDYHFSGFQPGRYLIYTYAVNTIGHLADTRITVPGSAVETQTVTGPMPGNQFILGATHSVHDLTLTGSSFEIDILGQWSYSECNGFQIRAVPEPSSLALLSTGLVYLAFSRREI